ncbi:hypothetical protein M758_UG005400, partial [Ceratodon purpureus]
PPASAPGYTRTAIPTAVTHLLSAATPPAPAPARSLPRPVFGARLSCHLARRISPPTPRAQAANTALLPGIRSLLLSTTTSQLP